MLIIKYWELKWTVVQFIDKVNTAIIVKAGSSSTQRRGPCVNCVVHKARPNIVAVVTFIICVTSHITATESLNKQCDAGNSQQSGSAKQWWWQPAAVTVRLSTNDTGYYIAGGSIAALHMGSSSSSGEIIICGTSETLAHSTAGISTS